MIGSTPAETSGGRSSPSNLGWGESEAEGKRVGVASRSGPTALSSDGVGRDIGIVGVTEEMRPRNTQISPTLIWV